MQHTYNALSANIRAQSIELLNRHLAAAIDLRGQVKQAHWNVRGPSFIAVHELFDSDTLAERAAALGGTAQGTVHIAAEHSFLPPYTLGVAGEKEHLIAVSTSLAAFGQSARSAIDEAAASDDADTADLFNDVSRSIDQQLWSYRLSKETRAASWLIEHCSSGDTLAVIHE